jgi:hypothetical protein
MIPALPMKRFRSQKAEEDKAKLKPSSMDDLKTILKVDSSKQGVILRKRKTEIV